MYLKCVALIKQSHWVIALILHPSLLHISILESEGIKFPNK